MEMSEKYWENEDQKERVFMGHQYIHVLNTETKEFKELNIY